MWALGELQTSRLLAYDRFDEIAANTRARSRAWAIMPDAYKKLVHLSFSLSL